MKLTYIPEDLTSEEIREELKESVASTKELFEGLYPTENKFTIIQLINEDENIRYLGSLLEEVTKRENLKKSRTVYSTDGYLSGSNPRDNLDILFPYLKKIDSSKEDCTIEDTTVKTTADNGDIALWSETSDSKEDLRKKVGFWPKDLGEYAPKDYSEYSLMWNCREDGKTYKEYLEILGDYRKLLEQETKE